MLVPLSVLLIGFALANRHLVVLNLNPFTPPAETGAGVPMFLVIYSMLLIGVLLGGVASWLAQGRHRKAERHWRREAQSLGDELSRQRRREGEARRSGEIDELLDIR